MYLQLFLIRLYLLSLPGNSNTGELVKDLFKDPAKYAKILGMPKLEPLIKGIDDLLVAVNSKCMVNVPEFEAKCNALLDYFHQDPGILIVQNSN